MSETVYIIMGVSGCGKTTIGKKLGDLLSIPFYDADNFHSSENVSKMKNGIGLNDSDRKNWLVELNKNINTWSKTNGAVLACSALKEKYRNDLQKNIIGVKYVYLDANKELIEKRFHGRPDHFMPSSLINSQFNDLEIPETAITLDASCTIAHIMDQLGAIFKSDIISNDE